MLLLPSTQRGKWTGPEGFVGESESLDCPHSSLLSARGATFAGPDSKNMPQLCPGSNFDGVGCYRRLTFVPEKFMRYGVRDGNGSTLLQTAETSIPSPPALPEPLAPSVFVGAAAVHF
jgi:hypothetical protein